jgi:hypothetical protein
MGANPTPRQMAKGLLNGIVPPRPLFLPIVFSLGAKVENVPLGTFLTNPAKITSSLRQMRGPLGADGVACYFDPYLEVEALGAILQRPSDGQQPALDWAQAIRAGELPGGLCRPEEAARNGRVPIAVEVIKRMNAIPNRDFLLMAGVTGPLTLAARLTQLENNDSLRNPEVPDAQQLAACVAAEMASAFLGASSDLIFIQEEILPVRSAEAVGAWADLLAPVVNIARFYEAVPVLQLLDVRSILENWDAIFQQKWDCVVSLPLEALAEKRRAGPLSANANAATLGIALPLDAFRLDGTAGEGLRQVLHPMISELRPALVTTAGDVPVATDMKHLIKVLEGVPRAV